MGDPAIGHDQIISSGIATTKVEFPDPAIKRSRPYYTRILESIGIVVLLSVDFQQQSVVKPGINQDGLEHNVDPLMWGQVEHSFNYFCFVTE